MKNYLRFIIGLCSSVYHCLKNRNKVIIIVTPADLSTVIEGKKTSPFAFALQQKFLQSKGIKPLIVLRSNDYAGKYNYDFSISEMLALGNKLKRTDILWHGILKLLNPKILFAIDWDLSLNKSCNNSNTPLYYMQHGVIAEDHMYFGRILLEQMEKRVLPTGFICWDEASTENFRDIIEAYNVGNLWNISFIKKEVQIKSLINQLPAHVKNNKASILITLTWGNPQFTNLPESIIEVIKKTRCDYNWIIRLHPVINQSKQLFRQFDDFLKRSFTAAEIESLEWESVSDLPLPILFSRVSCHITIESSVVIEAAQFGVQSLILNPNVIKVGPKGAGVAIIYGGPSYYKKEREYGYATIFDHSLSIQEWINNAISVKKEPLIDIELHNREWEFFARN